LPGGDIVTLVPERGDVQQGPRRAVVWTRKERRLLHGLVLTSFRTITLVKRLFTGTVVEVRLRRAEWPPCPACGLPASTKEDELGSSSRTRFGQITGEHPNLYHKSQSAGTLPE